MDNRVPVNTQRKNRNGFKQLAQYVLSLINSIHANGQYNASTAIAVSEEAANPPGVD